MTKYTHDLENLCRMLCFSFFILLITACSDISDVGGQSDAKPQASASILGAQALSSPSDTVQVRSGTDVLLSGKDSDGVDDPLLEFTWAQTDNSAYRVNLIERSRNARVFTAPNVTVPTELIFQLTVTDGDGVTAKDSVNVLVIPVADVDGFLMHPDTALSSLTLLAAPEEGELTGSVDEAFEVQADFILHWRNRNDVYDSMSIGSETRSSIFPMNYRATDQVTDLENPRLTFSIPQIKIDDINRHFETEQRERRLELYEIDSAFIEIQLTLVPLTTTVDFKLYAFDGSELIVASDITSPTISGDSRLRAENAFSISQVTDIPAEAELISSTSGSLQQRVYAEELKQQLGADNVQTARNYYKLIDPSDQFVYLKDWLVHAGFTDEYGKAIDDPSIAHAIYVNNYDLGFGRNMWTRVADNGNVYSYVVNYPSLEAAVQDRGEFAVVVMEYSENPDPAGANEKIVKFYAYVPDKVSGDFIRANTMNFDGRGEKALPGVCTSCHFQSSDSLGRQFTSVSEADLDATFLPWDLDSFLYSSASDASLVDPSYNTVNVDGISDFDASREAQEAQFKKLNEAALATYLDNPVNPSDPTGPKRHDATIELLHCMYGDAEMLEEPEVLPAETFDSNCVQPGWVGQEDLYHQVYARNCRACHTQFFDEAGTVNNFDSYSQFTLEANVELIKDYVFEQGRMPLARLTMDRFWIDFDGGLPAAELLRTHLEGVGQSITSSPGEPVPKLSVSGITTVEDESFPNQVNLVDTTLTFDASDSLFSDRYLWALNSSDCAQLPVINDANSARISFVLDSADYFPCSFELSLDASNDSHTTSQNYVFRATRIPSAVDIAVDLDEENYESGDYTVDIAVDSKIIDRGDDTLTVQVADPRVTNNNDGSLSFALSEPLQGINTSFSYTLEDIDGSQSDSGLITLNVPEIKPSVSNETPTANSVVLNWVVPTGFNADEYLVMRKLGSDSAFSNTPEASYSGSVFTHLSSGLNINQQYDYKVIAVLGTDQNDSDSVTISTQSGTPSGLVAQSRSSNSISLSWSEGPGGTPDCYNVYLNSSRLVSCISASSYTHTGLSANENYRYQVSAVFNTNESSLSTQLSVNTLAVAPSISSITNGTTSVRVYWSDSVNQNTPSYQVYRRTGSGIFSAHGAATSNKSLLSSTNSNTSYSYYVCVQNLDGGQQCSSVASITTIPTTSDIGSLSLSGGSCSGCHGSLYKSKVQAKANKACFYNGDNSLGDCISNMNFGITSSQEDALELWILNGLPD
ncbi:MAG: fibronectin type III domain-containing protein [Oleiphilus sp.]